MTIYTTQEWKGYGKQNYFWNEYRLKSGEVIRYKCHRQKIFNSHENERTETKEKVDAWNVDDPNMLAWLKKCV